MHKVKQFDLLIDAFSSIKENHNDWDLVILGDGEERESLEKLAKNLDVSDRVFFPGIVGNMAEWYERTDLFVLSSILEGFPNVLLEAMSYGVPSISFDCDTGPRDIIHDGTNGILVDPLEKESGLINALEELITNEKLRQDISNSSIHLREKYSVSNTMNEWDRVLGL